MDIDRITPANALHAVLAALNEIADAHAAAAPGDSSAGPASLRDVSDVLGRSGLAGQDDGHGGLAGAASAGHGAEHFAKAATADSTVLHPDARLEHGAESALVQSFARRETPLPGAWRAGDTQPATPALAGNDFSLPADQLLNAAVIGLQVEPAFAWQLQRHGFDAAPPQQPEPRNDSPVASPSARREAPRAAANDPGPPADRRELADEDADADRGASQDDAAPDDPPEPPTAPVPSEANGDWSEPLSRALRLALRQQPAPPALLAAAEQWRVGRCVVLACPQGPEAAGPAWAFVLWPRRGSLATIPLTLFGLRVEARLHWSRLPPSLEWCHARVMKEQHTRQGRQLVAVDAHGTATVPCEVQLGPVPLRTPRWRDACVRIDAMRQFWNALGQQWSVTVVVGSRPLAGIPAARWKEAPWEA